MSIGYFFITFLSIISAHYKSTLSTVPVHHTFPSCTNTLLIYLSILMCLFTIKITYLFIMYLFTINVPFHHEPVQYKHTFSSCAFYVLDINIPFDHVPVHHKCTCPSSSFVWCRLCFPFDSGIDPKNRKTWKDLTMRQYAAGGTDGPRIWVCEDVRERGKDWGK